MTVSKNMRAYWDERDRLAFELREQGLTWPQIAKQTGRTAQGAQKGAKRWQAQQRQQATEAA